MQLGLDAPAGWCLARACLHKRRWNSWEPRDAGRQSLRRRCIHASSPDPRAASPPVLPFCDAALKHGAFKYCQTLLSAALRLHKEHIKQRNRAEGEGGGSSGACGAGGGRQRAAGEHPVSGVIFRARCTRYGCSPCGVTLCKQKEEDTKAKGD